MAEETCCGCVELRTGCLVIGYLQLVGEIIALGLCAFVIIVGGVINVQAKEDTALATTLVILAYIVVFCVAISFIFTALLLAGVYKNKPGYVQAYIVFTIIILVLNVISFLGSLASMNFLMILQQVIMTAINIYFLMVVKRYRTKMVEEPRAPGVQYKV